MRRTWRPPPDPFARDWARKPSTRIPPKWLGGDAVDGSLLAVGAVFELFEADDPTMLATIERIEADLVHAGGGHRYLDDTYYGGGEWLLLAGIPGPAICRQRSSRGGLVAARVDRRSRRPEG